VLSFSPDGKRLASTSYDRAVRLWDVEKGAQLRVFEKGAHTPSATWTPDGGLLVTQATYTGLWDSTTGELKRRYFEHAGGVNFALMTPDGRLVASLGQADRLLRLWDAGSAVEKGRMGGHSREARRIALSRDGSRAATLCDEGRVIEWDLAAGAPTGRKP